MSDEAKFTQADLDAAIEKAVGPLRESIDKLESKNSEIVGENRRLKSAGATPEMLAAETQRADKAEAERDDYKKQLTTVTKERDTFLSRAEAAEKAGMEQARNSAIAGNIAKGNLVPALVDGYSARVEKLAVTEWKDGKWVTTIEGKDAAEWIKADLEGEIGKAYRAAPNNSGGGAPGGNGAPTGGKTVTRQQFDAMSHPERTVFAKEGGKIDDLAA